MEYCRYIKRFIIIFLTNTDPYVKLLFNMDKDYTKINLRDFRHNLTQLKDAMEAGFVYEVMKKGKTFGYFVPAKYEIEIKEKKKIDREAFQRALEDAIGCAKEEGDENFDYKKEYMKLLEEEYLK